MDLDLLELHTRALESTRRILAGITADQWGRWIETAHTDVRTLTNHLVTENSWVAVLLDGHTMEAARERFSVMADPAGDDPLAAYDRSAASADAAFRAPGALRTECRVPPSGATSVGAEYCGTRFVDVLVHGWEIAKVTGQSTRLDPTLAAAAHTVIEPQIRALFEQGVIRAPLDVGADSDAQARFLALFGFSDDDGAVTRPGA
jgi:uncharacterized protein (TIGR03086 family)